MFDLSGRTAIVTGAGQNVGAGIARALAAQGATVHVNDIVGERAQQTVDQITGAGRAAGARPPAPFDVTDYDAVTDAIAAIGTVDILVNNAGNGGAEGMGLTQFRASE